MNRAQWITVLSLLAATTSAQAKEGLVISQKGALYGADVIYLERQYAVKVVDLQSTISLIARKPDWRVFLINGRTKTWCPVTKALKSPFSNTSLWMATGQDFDALRWQPSGASTIAGQTTVDFKTLLTDPNTGKATSKRPAHVYALKEDVLPKDVADALCRFLNAPQVGNVPIKVIYTNGFGEPIKVLDTKSVQAKPISDAEFVVPKGYRQLATQEQVVHDPNKQQAIEDMVQSMGH